MAQKYSILNAAIASLQFWTEDLDPITLGIASEHVYTPSFGHLWATCYANYLKMFFWTLCYYIKCCIYPAVILSRWGLQKWFWHFDLPTPLRKTPCIHNMPSMEHASFNPAHTTPCSTTHSSPQTPTRPVHHCLSFNSDSDQDPDSTSVYSNSSDDNQDPDNIPVYSDEEEDFPTVPLDDKHWTSDVVPERNFLHTQKCTTK